MTTMHGLIRLPGTGRAAPLAVLALLGAAWSHPALADGGSDAYANATPAADADPFPITVEVVPELVVVTEGASGMAGRRVTVKGRTLAMGSSGDRPVVLSFDSDDPPVHSAAHASVGEDGAYSNEEFAAVAPGEYTITATAPDGRGTATATLTAISVPELTDRAPASMQKAQATVDETLAEAEKKVEEKPDSPAKTEALEKLANIRKAHQAYVQQNPAEHVHGFLGAIYESGSLLEGRVPQLQEMTETLGRMEAQSEQVERMTSQLGSADEGCQQMAFVLELVKAVGTLVSIEAQLTKQVIGMSKDILADVASNQAKKLGDPKAGLAASFLAKNGDKYAHDLAIIDGKKGATALFADFAAFGIEQLFDAYCKRFVGPVEGTFTGQFYRKVRGETTMWWRQSYKLSGRILLRYPKSARGPDIQMTGRIEGYAHSFDSWDNGLKAFDEQGIMGGAMVAKKIYPPFDAGAAAAEAMSQGAGPVSAQVWGSMAGALVPNSFAMHVRGELNDDSLSLLIGDRITDFTSEDRVVAVIVSPLSAGVGPSVTWYSLPYVDGHSVIAGGADDAPVRLELTTAGKVITAKGEVDNEIDTEHAHGEYHLTFKACNPGC